MTPPMTPGLTGWMHLSAETTEPKPNSGQNVFGLQTSLKLHQFEADNFACTATESLHIGGDNVLAVMIGNPCWKDANIEAIAKTIGQSEALAHAYQKYEQALTDYLSGNFVFALMDTDNQTAILGTDRMGRYPLYYARTDSKIFFGSTANSVLALLDSERTPQPQGIYDYVYFHMVPSPTSVFEGVKKLQAGNIAVLNQGQLNANRYWQPAFLESNKTSVEKLHLELKSQLHYAVASSIPAQGKVGAFLSGGLDSSTVTGMLANISDQPCDAYSIGFAAEGYDEMEYARITANHFGVRLHEYYVTPEDVVSALPLIATSYDEPFGNSSALPAYFCAKMAASDGVKLLLAGDGGDEIFAGNERYSQQRVFELSQNLPSWIRAGLLEPLIEHTPSWVPLVDKSRSYIAQANTPLPDRLQTYNFLHQYPARDIFQPEFLRDLLPDSPLELQRDIYCVPQDASMLNRMLYLDWQFTLADNDLRKVSHMCAVAGVEVAYPMLDDALVEFSMGIPSALKMPGSKLRDFYKSALSGWLPDATITKKKQGFGLPFGVWMQEYRPLRELAYDNVVKLKSRHIFNPEFIDNAIELHREGHAAYFGELIWILTVLELWMEANC